jgi:cephalosporin-C deacetylase
MFPFLSDYKRVWDMDLDAKAYKELRDFFRSFDPTHTREDEIFTTLGYIDVHHLAPWIRADTLMLASLIDEICPPSTQFAAYNAITAEKRMVLYPDFGHEQLPGGADEVFTHMLGL